MQTEGVVTRDKVSPPWPTLSPWPKSRTGFRSTASWPGSAWPEFLGVFVLTVGRVIGGRKEGRWAKVSGSS